MGVRPCVIVRSPQFDGSSTTVVLPTTTKPRSRVLHVRCVVQGAVTFALTDQIRTVDLARLSEPIGRVSPEVLAEIEDALALLLGIV